jgi:O-antigen ligase
MRTPALYRFCDAVTEVVFYFMVIFYPWAFGTTERWAIWIMNAAGYTLGAMLAAKWIVRWRAGYRPSRWSDRHESDTALDPTGRRRARAGRILTAVLALATVALLGYCLTSALNARVVYFQEQGESYQAYLPCLTWLPHSYDQAATWLAFWSYAGLACVFWAARDLLLGKSPLERQQDRERSEDVPPPPTILPERLRRLLWVVLLNGAWLAVVAILQRLSGTPKLLWIMDRTGGFPPDFAFGPYAYRSNAAQFFNLLWPVCLGFWTLSRHRHMARTQAGARAGSGPHMLLLPVAVLMAACPIVSTSRGGALLSAVMLPLVVAWLMWASRSRQRHRLAGLLMIVGCLLALGIYLGWAPLERRLRGLADLSKDPSSVERVEQYRATWQMVQEHTALGVGPYAYKAVYQYYLSPGQRLYSFAHNDWLQTLAEWGVIGSAPIALGLIAWVLLLLVADQGDPLLPGLIGLSLAAGLVHASFDFPLQVQSILFVVVLWMGVAISLPPLAPGTHARAHAR